AEPEVTDLMAGLGQPFGQSSHPREDREDLLGVVDDVVGLGADLHEHVGHRRVFLPEPGVSGIQLVTEDETDGVGHARKGGLRRRMASDLPNPFATRLTPATDA
ncbi:MAG: hypothetical protein RL592_1549, partial [Verrucomicrobiota bacterium]